MPSNVTHDEQLATRKDELLAELAVSPDADSASEAERDLAEELCRHALLQGVRGRILQRPQGRPVA